MNNDSNIFYMLTNKKEKQYDYQFYDGLNVLQNYFSENPLISNGNGGFYFSDFKNILKYLNEESFYLREIYLQTNDNNLKLIKNSNFGAHNNFLWKSNKIVFGKKYLLSNPETFRMLINKGAYIYYSLLWCIKLFRKCKIFD